MPKSILIPCFAIATLMPACGTDQSLSIDEKLVIGIMGSFSTPEGATGDAEPRNMTLTLEDITATAATAGEFDLYTDEAMTVVVASRSQILMEADIADYVDDTITEVRVTFSATATAKGKYEEELAVTLLDPVAVHTESFVVKPAQTRRINVLVDWRDIVTRNDSDTDIPPTETISSPALNTDLID